MEFLTVAKGVFRQEALEAPAIESIKSAITKLILLRIWFVAIDVLVVTVGCNFQKPVGSVGNQVFHIDAAMSFHIPKVL